MSQLQQLAQSMARSSVIEYKIGVLIAQALDKVGDLVTLNRQRVDMHDNLSRHSPQSLDTLLIQSILHQALAEAFNAVEGSQGNPAEHRTAVSSTLPQASQAGNASGPAPASLTPDTLTSHQLQELGATFGRDPSAFKDVVSQMWHSGRGRPDVTSIVTRRCLLMLA
ncbi:hypothetical protein NMY22_g17841 [Coprinellus aureogranulatus]|nr:hypothetical protein NMY22_g17841 [Coprinellus aureogranulatus]